MGREQQRSVRHFDHCPWLFDKEATAEQRAVQRERQQAIGGDNEVGERCYVAESAAVFPDRLRLGDNSYIAAHAYWMWRTPCGCAPASSEPARTATATGPPRYAHGPNAD